MSAHTTIDLPLFYPDTSSFELVVPADILIDIAPHLASMATFAVHRCPFRGLWQVSNVETGAHVRGDQQFWPTRQQAVANAAVYLLTKTTDDIARAYRYLGAKVTT